MKIDSNEKSLIGTIEVINGKLTFNDVVQRINYLTKEYLIKLATDSTGWDILYQDPIDKRYWEKVYLQSELHGGGPPSLLSISKEEAINKYMI